ncbi:MAG: hypothetical protein J0I06_03895 [Planctomycetes bacterium]|nr:hypothetical protein [Planctomycetota bacterium]
MRRPALVLACLFAAAAPSGAASPNPEDLVPTPEVRVKCRALVRQLGSEDFTEREDAQKQLAALGRSARPALLAGANTSSDPEVRARCAQLLPAANALDLQAKLETFLADTDGRYEHDLAAWKTFRAVVCNEWSFCGHTLWSDRALERAARQVFVEMVATHANRRLLMAVDGSRVELTELVVARKMDLYGQRGLRGEGDGRPLTLDEMAALLFADSRVGSQYIPRRSVSIGSALSGSGFVSAARGGDDKAKVYRAIAAAWLDSRNEPREMTSAMSVASSLDLNDQAAGLAARLFSMPGVTALVRGRAASNLVSYGGKKHIPLLEKALADTVVVASVRPAAPTDGAGELYEVQVRDVALGVAIALAEQKPEDYGFTDRYAGVPGYENRYYAHTRYYFADDAARKKAFAKWAEWRKANPNG